MMYKMPANLMIINKMMIFCESLLEEDINGEFFSEKVMYDLEFINSKMSDFWEEYLKYIDIYERENFLKTYTFSLRRLKNILEKLIKNSPYPNNIKIDEYSLNNILDNIVQMLDQIKKHKNRLKIAGSEYQIINEEEYSLLFENLDENN